MPTRPILIVFGAAVRPDGEPSGTLRRRVEGAVAHAAEKPDALFLVTGGKGRHGPAEADVMAALLRDAGIGDDRILAEDASRDTLDSVVNCHRLLRKLGEQVGTVTVCTSRYHAFRCALLLRLAGINVEIAPTVPDRPHVASHRLAWSWLREVPATMMDVPLVISLRLRGRFSDR